MFEGVEFVVSPVSESRPGAPRIQWVGVREERPSGAKAQSFFGVLSARLKSCPFKASSIHRAFWCLPVLLIGVVLVGCRSERRDPSTVVVLIESSPANLDPRVGTDAQSERIYGLIFDGLVARDAHFNFSPALAERWEQPDPLTLIFHLRAGVRFHDGRALTARDVAFTIESMLNPKMPGGVISPRAASYAAIDRIETPDDRTVVMHLKRPDNYLLMNLSTGAMGIVPLGSGRDFWLHPVGTGPFRFVSQQIDQDVTLERNEQSWSVRPKLRKVRFAVVPDAITESLELEKGSGDVAVNSLPMDSLGVLAGRPNLQIEETGGTEIQYLSFNIRDPLLIDARVRQAIACAIDRKLIMKTLLDGRARAAASLLPPDHWAWNGDGVRYDYDPARAERLLDDAGHRRDAGGVRFHLTMKTSSNEGTRLLAAVLQQQLAPVGIAMDIRSFETATFYADVMRGAFQMYSLQWVGGNEQPDIFGYAFSSARIPPKGANRGHYLNARLDAVLDDAAQNADMAQRKADYAEAQQILARDVPAINLWYRDTVVVHNKRLTHVVPAPSGSYVFLETAELAQ